MFKKHSDSKIRLAFVALMVSVMVPFTASAQQHGPSPRSSGLFIYHPASKAMLLLDGHQFEKDSLKNNVWKWNGELWKELPSVGPGTRSLTAGALDSYKGMIVRFGGLGFKNYDSKKGDAWSFDGKKWSERRITGIGTRDHHKMVYADHLNSFVVYGGYNEERKWDTVTWLLKDDQFIPLNIPGPGPRAHFGLSYDKERKRVVLFGGLNGTNGESGDLWEFDGEEWILIRPKEQIGTRIWHGMVYHDKLKLTIVQGGYTAKPKDRSGDSTFMEYPKDTWGWDGSRWKRLSTNGPSSILPAIGYDPRKNVVWYYSGAGKNSTLHDFLWEFRNGKWKQISDNGIWKRNGATFEKFIP